MRSGKAPFKRVFQAKTVEMRHYATSSVKSLKKFSGRGNTKYKDTELRVGCMCFKNCQKSQWSWGTMTQEV